MGEEIKNKYVNLKYYPVVSNSDSILSENLKIIGVRLPFRLLFYGLPFVYKSARRQKTVP